MQVTQCSVVANSTLIYIYHYACSNKEHFFKIFYKFWGNASEFLEKLEEMTLLVLVVAIESWTVTIEILVTHIQMIIETLIWLQCDNKKYAIKLKIISLN